MKILSTSVYPMHIILDLVGKKSHTFTFYPDTLYIITVYNRGPVDVYIRTLQKKGVEYVRQGMFVRLNVPLVGRKQRVTLYAEPVIGKDRGEVELIVHTIECIEDIPPLN